MKYFLGRYGLFFLFSLLLINHCEKQDSISDMIRGMVKTPGSENFMMNSIAFTQFQESAKKPLLGKKAAKVKPKSKKNKKNKKKKAKVIRRPKLDPTKLYKEGWLSVSSHSFKNIRKFPALEHSKGDFSINVTKKYFRINEKYQAKHPSDKKRLNFWFRLSGRYLYYSNDEDDLNVLDNIHIQYITKAQELNPKKNKKCFNILSKEQRKFIICASSVKNRNSWVCKIQEAIGQIKSKICGNKQKKGKASEEKGNIIVKTVTQPYLIIPYPSRNCNDKWDYLAKGTDWECECKEGKEQSPINLPPSKDAVLSSLKPIFNYEKAPTILAEDYKDGLIKAGEFVKIRFIENALRIYHPFLGKIVTLDGSVYHANEIVFHTPAEHTINGKHFEMEMQIIHKGVSVGDVAKHVVLSVLFKKKAGHLNRFLDKIDPFNLPNPFEKVREITESLYIPDVFLSNDDPDNPLLKDFNFYTYQGSLTNPPCTERTIHYVVSQPQLLSSTTLELFKEALRMPDFQTSSGDIIQNHSYPTNNRDIQPLNGRAVFYYDTLKFCGPELIGGDKRRKPVGHFEKKISQLTEYFHVNGVEPSGLPGAYVVSSKEAKKNLGLK